MIRKPSVHKSRESVNLVLSHVGAGPRTQIGPYSQSVSNIDDNSISLGSLLHGHAISAGHNRLLVSGGGADKVELDFTVNLSKASRQGGFAVSSRNSS